MNRRDFSAVLAVGILVGLLIQPVLSNVYPHAISIGLRVLVFLGLSVFAPLALWIAYLLGKILPVLYQFAKFAAVGTLNTMIDFGVLNLEILLTGVSGGALYPVFKGVSFIASTTNSYFWNRHWTFEAQGGMSTAEATKFYAIAIVGWVLNVGAASAIVLGIRHPSFVSPGQWANVGALAGVAASFLWDFLGYKYLVFKEKRIA